MQQLLTVITLCFKPMISRKQCQDYHFTTVFSIFEPSENVQAITFFSFSKWTKKGKALRFHYFSENFSKLQVWLKDVGWRRSLRVKFQDRNLRFNSSKQYQFQWTLRAEGNIQSIVPFPFQYIERLIYTLHSFFYNTSKVKNE